MLEKQIHPTITFQKASLPYKETVFSWLNEPHVQEFWDNSPEHKQDIEIFMCGRKEPSPYADGIFDYWIGFIDNAPYCLIMTSQIFDDQNLVTQWRPYLSETGKTFSIDFMIGNPDYLGKGLGAITLDLFVHFINSLDSNIDTFIIDPNINNPRAQHVYAKAGFKLMGEFTRKNEQFYLMVKKMS